VKVAPAGEAAETPALVGEEQLAGAVALLHLKEEVALQPVHHQQVVPCHMDGLHEVPAPIGADNSDAVRHRGAV
jgi:hypothetical protein